MNSHLAPDDEGGYLNRRTGPSSEPPARCYICGADVPETPRFGNEATCDDCARRGIDPREKGDDDGREYADPRDYREGLE